MAVRVLKEDKVRSCRKERRPGSEAKCISCAAGRSLRGQTLWGRIVGGCCHVDHRSIEQLGCLPAHSISKLPRRLESQEGTAAHRCNGESKRNCFAKFARIRTASRASGSTFFIPVR